MKLLARAVLLVSSPKACNSSLHVLISPWPNMNPQFATHEPFKGHPNQSVMSMPKKDVIMTLLLHHKLNEFIIYDEN